MPDDSNTVSALETLVKSPKSIAGWGGMIASIGTFIETNAADTWQGWVTAGLAVAASALTIVLPALSSSASK